MNKERTIGTVNGIAMIFVVIALYALAAYLMVISGQSKSGIGVTGAICLFIANSILTGGFFIVEPNGSKVTMLFGTYKGTERKPGLHWANPFLTKRGISLRARTLNGQILKVNDKIGNPVEIAAIILWKVADTYEASFEVNDYESFVAMQSETAMRHLAGSFPYDTDGTELSLMHNTDEVSAHLMAELQDRLRRAGVEVLEARLSHLAYSPEIAGVMLRRQQAAAVVAARSRIVDGAVGMVKQALDKLMKEGVVELDDERKAQMVSNLMVVLCGEQPAQPVLNAGTLYA
ncbi:MAG: SPFH domain-containing protein [Fimbriimonadaceae bacterium]